MPGVDEALHVVGRARAVGQVQVEQDHVGLLLPGGQQLGHGAGRGDHDDLGGLGEHRGQTAAHRHVVVDRRHPHGAVGVAATHHGAGPLGVGDRRQRPTRGRPRGTARPSPDDKRGRCPRLSP